MQPSTIKHEEISKCLSLSYSFAMEISSINVSQEPALCWKTAKQIGQERKDWSIWDSTQGFEYSQTPYTFLSALTHGVQTNNAACSDLLLHTIYWWEWSPLFLPCAGLSHAGELRQLYKAPLKWELFTRFNLLVFLDLLEMLKKPSLVKSIPERWK